MDWRGRLESRRLFRGKRVRLYFKARGIKQINLRERFGR